VILFTVHESLFDAEHWVDVLSGSIRLGLLESNAEADSELPNPLRRAC